MPRPARFLSILCNLFLCVTAMGESAVTTPAAREATGPLNYNTYFGMNGVGFFHRPHETADLEYRWELMKELGVQWDRSDFFWSDIETAPGKWDYSKPDKAMRTYREHGVQMFPILDYGARWRDTRGPSNDEERDEWAQYVRNMVGRYRGYCNYWEVWNEPNIIPFWRPQPKVEDYAKLLKLTAKVAREVNPDVKIVGFACADLDLPFIQRVLELNGSGDFDVASYHFYRMGTPEEKTPDEVRELRLLLQHFGKSCPVWVTENGVTSYFKDGVSEDLQAIRWMRQNLVMIEAGVDRIFPFTLIDNLGDPGGEWGLQLGMVRRDRTKKPVFHAYRTMIQELNDFELVGPVYFNSDVRALLFKGRQAPDQKLVVWSTRDARDIKLPFDDDASTNAIRYTTLLGEKRAPEWSNATARVMVGPAPIYVPVKSQRLQANAETRWEPQFLMSSPGYDEETSVVLAQGESIVGGLKFELPDGWTGEERNGKFLFRVPAGAHAEWYTVRAQVPYEWGTIQKELRVWVRKPLSVQVRPHATTTTSEIVTHFAVHNFNLKKPVNWSFEATPEIAGVEWPAGALASTNQNNSPYYAEGSTTITRHQLSQITTTTKIQFVADDLTRRAFQFAVTPIAKTDPIVDGELSEYTAAPPMELGHPDQLQRGKIEGEMDARAVMRALWRPQGLYVAADVTDEHPMMNDYGTGQEVYKGDGVEVYIGPSGYTGQYYANKGHGAWHFCLTPGRSGEGAAVSDFEKVVEGSDIVVRAREGGYAIEAFIPRSAFGNYSPASGDIIAWDVQLNDRDDYSRTEESKAFMWNGDGMNWLKAAKWGMALVK